MFSMWILAKYAVILRVVGMNCTRDGAVVERSRNEWKPRRSDFKKIRSSLQSESHRSTPLRSHTLIVSNRFCHDRFISEPAAIKIIWLRARARYYCWRVSFGPRAACCWPLLYRDIRTDQRDGLWDLCTNQFLQNAGDFSQGSVQARHFVTGPLATVLPLLLLY